MSDWPSDEDGDEDELDEDDEFAEWETVDIGDGTSELMPPEDSYEFLDHVEVIERASGSAGSIGPMTREYSEYICRFRDVMLLHQNSDGDRSNQIVGRRASIGQCVEASEAFVIGSGGVASAWSDSDLDGEIIDEELWDPDDEDDDVRSTSFSYSVAERREAFEKLQRTSITLNDARVAGDDAVSELPANTTWFAIPCTESERSRLDAVLGSVQLVTIDADGEQFDGAFSDRMAATTAARVGAAFGASEIWQLDRDSICTITLDTPEPTLIAEATRIR